MFDDKEDLEEKIDERLLYVLQKIKEIEQAATCAKGNHFFAGPVLAFNKGVEDFWCISPPDWVAYNNGVVCRKVEQGA